MKRRPWLIGAALAGLLAMGIFGYRGWLAASTPSGSVEAFLTQHWAQPLAPQGEPPAQYSPLEASLASEDCGRCHQKQYDDWRTALHARAIGPGILWQLRIMKQSAANECLRCHAPLAEQKALTALEHGWSGAPAKPPPAYIPANLHHEGLTCAACHVRGHRRFGPPPRAASTPGAPIPHGGFVAQPAFEDSRFCAACHQFPPQARRVNGKLLENTYEEWRMSPAARAGRTCQSCHMPDRRHLWRGIHDPNTVRGGLQRELEVRRLDVRTLRAQAVVRNTGAGHNFPTYAVPKIYARLVLHRPGSAPREFAQRVIGRTLNVALDRELSDTRLSPGEALVFTADVPAPEGDAKVELRIDVAPGEHYERMFREWQTRPETRDPATAAMLREALTAAAASRYRLDSLMVTAPRGVGKAHRQNVN
jgi:hypothetical protein